MFTKKCFIRKNTKELQCKLLDIGLKMNTLDDFSGNCLAVNYGMFITQYRLNELKEYEHNEYIDCGDNEDLFIAIAALRDDSNEHQWYTDGTRWNFNKLDQKYDWMIDDSWHKATVEELIKHFNNKNIHLQQ